MRGWADHEGLPAQPGYEARPLGRLPSRPREVAEAVDLADFHRSALLASACEEPDGQLLAAGGRQELAVGENGFLLSDQPPHTG